MKTIEQKYPNLEAFLKSIEGINMAKKTAKRKYTKKASRWTAKRSGKNITATHQTEGSDVSSVVDAALQRMAAESAPQVWFNSPQKPGLHLMRTTQGQHFNYMAVRALYVDNGQKTCIKVVYENGGDADVELKEFTNPQFQKVQE